MKIKYTIFIIILIISCFGIYYNYYSHPIVKIKAVDVTKQEVEILIDNINVGDVVIMLENADNKCNSGSFKNVFAAIKKYHLIHFNLTNKEFINSFRIKIVSGKRVYCSEEFVINLNSTVKP